MSKKRRRLITWKKLEQMEAILRSGGATIEQLKTELEISLRTVHRYRIMLEERGVEITHELVDGRKYLTIVSRRNALEFKLSDLLVLVIAKQTMSSYQSSGLASYMREVVSDLRARMTTRARVQMDQLEEKIFFLDYAPYLPTEAADEFNALVSAMIFQRPVEMRHRTVEKGKTAFDFEPYRMVVYKQGLYFVGRSQHHNGIRTFGFDGCDNVELKRRHRFVIPSDFKLSLGTQFGLFGGSSTEVRLRFSRKVARFVKRRSWHGSQEVRDLENGVELHLVVDGTTELVSWILSFGGEVEVMEPPKLRRAVAREHELALERNRVDAVGGDS